MGWGWALAETIAGWAFAVIVLIFLVAALGALCRVLWWALVGE